MLSGASTGLLFQAAAGPADGQSTCRMYVNKSMGWFTHVTKNKTHILMFLEKSPSHADCFSSICISSIAVN